MSHAHKYKTSLSQGFSLLEIRPIKCENICFCLAIVYLYSNKRNIHG